MRNYLFSTVLGLGILAPLAVYAQEGPAQLEEVVVTAQRREESLQRAAVAVSAVTERNLVNSGVTETANLSRLVPALVVQPTGGSGATLYLRGVGTQSGNSFAENAVAFNFNGVYVARPTAVTGAFYDLQRVEVVKGPQGTLYGRNATGGAVNVLPRAPVLGEYEANALVDIGNYNKVVLSGGVNLPIGEKVALRIAGQSIDRDGYLSDGTQDEVSQGLRASLLAKPNDNWSALLVADYFRQDGKGAGGVLAPGSTAPAGFPGYAAPSIDERIGGSDPRSLAALGVYARTLGAPPFCGGPGGFITSGCVVPPAGDSFLDNDFFGVSLTLQGDLGFGTLTVQPAYRKSNIKSRSYLPGFLQDINEEATQSSLEVRLASNGDQRLSYVVGAFYFSEDQDALNFFSQGALATTRFTPKIETESKAVFGQATFDLTDTLRLVAGGRYTQESKTQSTAIAAGGRPGVVAPPLGAPFAGALDFEKFTWKAGVEWDAGPQSLVYANIATGFKSGGFFVAAPPNNTFAPEELTAYTVGAKNRFLDNRLQLNVEAFYWDYSDQQISFVGGVPTPAGIASGGVTVNAGAARMYGVDLDMQFAVTADARLTANVQYLDGKYESLKFTSFSNTGALARTTCAITGSRIANPGAAARLYDTDCTGKPTLNSPKWTANLGYEHTFRLGGDMDVVAGVNTRLETSRFLSPTYLPEQRQDAYMMSDAFITLEGPDDRWTLTGYVNNIEDEAVLANAGNRPILDVVYVSLRPPRTYGIRATARF